MPQLMKHVGKYGEKPCVVVFREVPNEPENCLIVQTSGLDPVQHDALMEVIQSPEAQEANDVSQVLNRRQFRDGENMLNSMHFGKKLSKVPVSQVSLTPTPSHSVPLAEVNAEIHKLSGGYVPPMTDESHLKDGVSVDTQPSSEAESDTPAEPSEAQSLVFQAQLMKEDAERMVAEAEEKLAQAYAIDPSLQPKKRGRPKKA